MLFPLLKSASRQSMICLCSVETAILFSSAAGGIERHRITLFDASLRVERIPHLPTRRRISAMTSSPGIGFTRPERTSSRRRTASAAH